jgi:hypothetical protein
MIKIKPSSKNTNKHTDQGMQLLETSIDKVGVIESISVTKEGTIISGHARKTLFDKKQMVAKEIHLEANEYPVIVTDIEDNTKQYFEAQILANTTANRNFDLDTDLIDEIAVEYDIDIEEVGVEVVEDNYDETDYSEKNKEFDANDFEDQKYTIKLEFTEEDYNFVKDKIKQLGQSPEKILYDALVSL